MVRRTERALGVAIRDGQKKGEITNPSTAAKIREARKSGTEFDSNIVIPRPVDFVPDRQESMAIYTMAHNVTDAQFEEALNEAVQEGNVSFTGGVVRRRQVTF